MLFLPPYYTLIIPSLNVYHSLITPSFYFYTLILPLLHPLGLPGFDKLIPMSTSGLYCFISVEHAYIYVFI
jgi:hypothetical protein